MIHLISTIIINTTNYIFHKLLINILFKFIIFYIIFIPYSIINFIYSSFIFIYNYLIQITYHIPKSFITYLFILKASSQTIELTFLLLFLNILNLMYMVLFIDLLWNLFSLPIIKDHNCFLISYQT